MKTVSSSFMFDKLDELLLELEEHDKEISAGVATVGEPAAYAEVWEWGNVRQTKKGPKTVLGINPDGEKVWLTIQAPFGYIRINENEFWQAVKDELAKVKFKSTTARGITEELEAAAVKAMKRCVAALKKTAPKDTGALRDSFEVVEPGDTLLDKENERTLILEE